ncbi:DUF2474 family protein [Cupriavidus necator]
MHGLTALELARRRGRGVPLMARILRSRLAARLGWLLALWLAGVATVFACASLMRLAMRAAGLAS